MGKETNAAPAVDHSPKYPEQHWRTILSNVWRQLPQIAAVAALGAAALFFIGWQYKQSLALNFGLSAYPGDMSFQSTVATGVTVFDASNTLIILATFSLALFLILILRAIPRLLDRWLDHLKEQSKVVEKELGLLTEKEKLGIFDDDFRSKLDEVTKLHRRIGIEQNVIGYIVFGTIPSLLVIFVSSFIMTGLGLYLLFQLGSEVAAEDARKIRIEARGPCRGCFLYSMKSSEYGLLGVAVFQSPSAIYVQEYDGLYQIEISDLSSVKPFLKVSGKPLTSPRR